MAQTAVTPAAVGGVSRETKLPHTQGAHAHANPEWGATTHVHMCVAVAVHMCAQVCGDAEVWGDFIVPVASAHLEGATNVNIDDCFHSPLGTKLMGPW